MEGGKVQIYRRGGLVLKKYDNIISYLYHKKANECLIQSDSKALEEQNRKVDKLEREIMKFIDQRIHPKSRKKFKKLIRQYGLELFCCICIEKELAYKNGFSDSMKMVLLSLVDKL